MTHLVAGVLLSGEEARLGRKKIPLPYLDSRGLFP
jgi:hypothetical protein